MFCIKIEEVKRNTFLDTCTLPKRNQENIKAVNNPIASNKIEAVMKT